MEKSWKFINKFLWEPWDGDVWPELGRGGDDGAELGRGGDDRAEMGRGRDDGHSMIQERISSQLQHC